MPDAGAAFPAIRELVPHGEAAVLLARVLSHDATTTTCLADADAAGHFRDDDGSIAAELGLEIMAQAIAVHGGLAARGEPRKPGFFVGTRRITFHTDRFEAGMPLVVTAKWLRSTGGLHAFDCSIVPGPDGTGGGAGSPLVSGILTVYLFDSFEAMAREVSRNESESD